MKNKIYWSSNVINLFNKIKNLTLKKSYSSSYKESFWEKVTPSYESECGAKWWFVCTFLMFSMIGFIIFTNVKYSERFEKHSYGFTVVGSEMIPNGEGEASTYLIIKDEFNQTREMNVNVTTFNKYKNKVGDKVYFKMTKEEYTSKSELPPTIENIFFICLILSGIIGICWLLISMNVYWYYELPFFIVYGISVIVAIFLAC